jgi:hypothetical protein
MPVNRDFRDLFAVLNDAGAEYLLVGGYALAFHGSPRFTKDLDVWVNPTPENAARVHAALGRFGAPLGDLSVADLATSGIVFQIGIAPNRIDVVTGIDGVEFGEAWPERAVTTYGDVDVTVIGKRHLVLNKRATGRPQDAVDADTLEGR